jgi:hypothetical protein
MRRSGGVGVQWGPGGDDVVGFGRQLGHVLCWRIWLVGWAQTKVTVGGGLWPVGCTARMGRLGKLFLFNNSKFLQLTKQFKFANMKMALLELQKYPHLAW